MERRGIITLIVALSVLMIGGLWYIFSKKLNKKFDWSETYNKDSQQPYGTYVVSNILTNYFPEKKFEILDEAVHKKLPLHDKEKGTYLFIGTNIFLSDKDADSLLAFISEGNNAFISSKKFPDNLITKTFDTLCVDNWMVHYEYKDTLLRVNFLHPSLKQNKDFVFESPVIDKTKFEYGWKGINSAYFCDTNTKAHFLSYFEESNGEQKIDFVDVCYGKGHLYLHTNPAFYANYYLIKEENVKYAEKTFSFLSESNIYWDEFSKLPSLQNENQQGRGESPLKFILSQRSLKYAWYLSLLLAAVYILFFAKRKQKAIAIVETKTNTSLEFIKTVGTLYFTQSNHFRLAKLKMKLFLNFLRERYQLSTNVVNEDLIKKVSLKSGIPQDKVEYIFSRFKIIEHKRMDFTGDELINFHVALDNFYKNCK